VICDPSDLTVSELYVLRVSLEKGICTFKPLPAANREALQAKVNEQVENGENPYGKQKRQDDAGKAKKKRRLLKLTVDHGSSYPPSDSNEDTPIDNVCPEIGLGQPHKVIHKHALNAPKVAQCSSSMSTTATASSSAHGARIVHHQYAPHPVQVWVQ